jgi:hypothetical protein
MSNFETPKLPEVKFNKNGYEIRADVLAMAKDFVGQDFHYKYVGWETSIVRDGSGKIITTVQMPEYPGVDKILETAEKMYNFVNQGQAKK